MDTAQIQRDLDEILELSSRKVGEILEEDIGGKEENTSIERDPTTYESDRPCKCKERLLLSLKSPTSVMTMTRHYVDVMGIVEDGDVAVPEAITNPSELIMMTSFAAAPEDYEEQGFSNQTQDENLQHEEPLYLETDPIIPENVNDEPPETDKHENDDEELDLTLKMKLKEAAFGFPPVADLEDLKEKLNKLNNMKLEQIKILDAAAKEATVQKKLKAQEVDGIEVQNSQPERFTTAGPETVKNAENFVTQRSESPEKEELFQADEDEIATEQTIEFLLNTPEPVAFAMQPEEDFTKSMENLNSDLKFFFGSEKISNSKPPKATQQEIKQDASSYYHLNDQSQSVYQLSENMQETDEISLVDESKRSDKLLLHDDMYEAPNQMNIDKIATFVTGEDIATKEEDELEPMEEVLEDRVEELKEKIFEKTKEEENFDAPTLIKLQENIVFEYSPETGALKFEKRPSLPQEEEDLVVEPEKAQNQKGKLRRSEGAEDLSVIGVNQSESSHQNVNHKTGAIKKVYNEIQNKTSKIEPSYTTVDIEEFPGLRSVATVSSLHEMIYSGQQEMKNFPKPKKNEGDDDDGFINLPKVPSIEISQVMSSAWIDENQAFIVEEKPSVHKRAPLGQAGNEKIKTDSTEKLPEIKSDTPTIKQKESKLLKCKCFLKRMSKALRKGKK